MTKARELGRQIDALDEIGQIIGAMRSLAFIEVRRLTDAADHRHEAMDAIESAIGDLVAHYPDALSAPTPDADVIIAVGSERGFCGDFNDAVANRLQELELDDERLLAVGSRLEQLLRERHIEHRAMGGAAVVEDVPQTLSGMVTAIEELSRRDGDGVFGLMLIHHDGQGVLHERRILPMPELPSMPRWRGKPDVQIKPRRLYETLVDHYVLTALNVSLLASLLAENHRRLDQMGSALDRLRDRLDDLGRKRRRARQEAVTEEIEVILLGVGSTGAPSAED